MRRVLACCLAAGAIVVGSVRAAEAGTIIAAVGATIATGDLPGQGNIDDTYNQSGLIGGGYISGVDDFDLFVNGKFHTSNYYNSAAGHVPDFEWFSNENDTEVTVTYDLGGLFRIDRLALWNEESSGAGTIDLRDPTNNINFFSLGLFTPTDNTAVPGDPNTPFYLADIFGFGPVDARYFQFNMSGCGIAPGSDNDYNACAIGEVAFASPVPEPGTLLLLGSGLAAAAARRRLRKRTRS